MDNPQKEITTSHVFTTKNQRQYPQTRKVVYTPARGAKKYMMQSPVSFVDQSEDELEMYERRRLGSTGQSYSGKSSKTATPTPFYNSHLVQEVSLSYSAPHMITPPSRDVPLTVSVSQGDRVDDYGVVNRNGSLQDYLSQYETRITKPRHIESVERVDSRGRQETEFPVRIAFIGGDSISPPPSTTVYSVPIVPVQVGIPYRSYDSRASTQRVGSALSDTLISETTTIEELTTITTTNHRRTPTNQEMPLSPTSVNALTQQFEQSARKQYIDVGGKRKTTSPGGTRVVVVTKPGPEYVYSSADESRVRRVDRSGYSPSEQRGIISTTIVDIEPAGYRSRSPRYLEETYQVQEEYRTIKTYSGPGQKKFEKEVVVSPESGRRQVVKESVREHISISRSSSPTRDELEQSRGSTPVRSVVQQFENKIVEIEKPRPKPFVQTESRDEYTVERKEVKEKPKEVYIPRGEYIPSRPAPAPAPTVTQPPRAPSPKKEIVVERAPSPKPEKVEQSMESREDRVKVDTWEEITTTTRKREQMEEKIKEVKEESKPKEEPKKDDMSCNQSSAAMHSSSSYSASSKSMSSSSASRGAIVSGGGMAEFSSSIAARPAFGSSRTVVSSSSASYGGALCQSGGLGLTSSHVGVGRLHTGDLLDAHIMGTGLVETGHIGSGHLMTTMPLSAGHSSSLLVEKSGGSFGGMSGSSMSYRSSSSSGGLSGSSMSYRSSSSSSGMNLGGGGVHLVSQPAVVTRTTVVRPCASRVQYSSYSSSSGFN